MNKAVFMDKDGTLIKDIAYNVDPSKIELNEYVTDFLQSLQSSGFLFIVISNQSGVAKGFFTESALCRVNEKINNLLHADGLCMDAFYYCPHSIDGVIPEYTINCNCRKPNPGLIKKAAVDWNIDLSRSWMIGDILHDVEAGNRAGCNTILLNNGNETEWNLHSGNNPCHIVSNLRQAAGIILECADEKKVISVNSAQQLAKAI